MFFQPTPAPDSDVLPEQDVEDCKDFCTANVIGAETISEKLCRSDQDGFGASDCICFFDETCIAVPLLEIQRIASTN